MFEKSIPPDQQEMTSGETETEASARDINRESLNLSISESPNFGKKQPLRKHLRMDVFVGLVRP